MAVGRLHAAVGGERKRGQYAVASRLVLRGACIGVHSRLVSHSLSQQIGAAENKVLQ